MSLPFDGLLLDRSPPDNTLPGWSLFTMGWIGIVAVLVGRFSELGWFANPCLLMGLITALNRQYSVALIAGVLATAFASLSFLVKDIPANEAVTMTNVSGYGSGLSLWFAAILLQLATAATLCVMHQRRRDWPKPVND